MEKGKRKGEGVGESGTVTGLEEGGGVEGWKDKKNRDNGENKSIVEKEDRGKGKKEMNERTNI